MSFSEIFKREGGWDLDRQLTDKLFMADARGRIFDVSNLIHALNVWEA